MLDQRKQFVTRRVGAPKKSRLPEPLKSYFESHSSEDLSSSYVFEHYLRCMRYYEGPKALLDWCKEHLRTKSLDIPHARLITRAKSLNELWIAVLSEKSPSENWYKEWLDGLKKDGANQFAEIMKDEIFIQRDTVGDLTLVWSGKVFENPFDFVTKNVWMWNAAVKYCLEAVKKTVRLKPTERIALRAMMARLDSGKEILKNRRELLDFLAKEKETDREPGNWDTIQRQINRAKKLIQRRD